MIGTFRCSIAILLCSIPAVGQATLPSNSSVASSAKSDSLSTYASERVRLSEILIATPQPYDPARVAEAQHKAEELRRSIQQESLQRCLTSRAAFPDAGAMYSPILPKQIHKARVLRREAMSAISSTATCLHSSTNWFLR